MDELLLEKVRDMDSDLVDEKGVMELGIRLICGEGLL